MLSDVDTAVGDATRNKSDGDGILLQEKYSNFMDGILTTSLPITVTDNITITPTVSYSFPLSSDAKNYIRANGMTDQPFRDKDSSFFLWRY